LIKIINMKNNCEVSEGSILFVKVNENPFSLELFISFSILLILNILFPKYEPLVMFLGLFIILSIIGIIVHYYDGLQEGFQNETYKCYYFSDRLVFYRISNHLDLLITRGKSTQELVSEQNELIGKKWTREIDEDILDERIKRLDEAIVVSENLRQPHKFVCYFNEFECFKSIKAGVIECVPTGFNANDKDFDSNYRYVKLTKEYKKCQNQIVDFLNKKVRESKTNASNF